MVWIEFQGNALNRLETPSKQGASEKKYRGKGHLAYDQCGLGALAFQTAGAAKCSLGALPTGTFMSSVSWRMHFAKLGAGPYRLLVFRHNLPVKQMHGSLRVLSESAVMGNHANGGSTLMQLGEKVHDCVSVLTV